MLVNEIFLSLQGEGIDIGLPTIFIRLTGCNLNCTWCDTDYAKTDGYVFTSSEIMSELHRNYHFCKRVCITGGEPLDQIDGVHDLLERLIAEQYDIVIETNGSISLEPLSDLLKKKNLKLALDVKTPSSGEQESFLKDNLKFISTIDMLKFVIADEKDLEFAVDFIENNEVNCNIIFTKVDGTDLKWLAEAVLENKLDVRILPQLHKIIWSEDAKGV